MVDRRREQRQRAVEGGDDHSCLGQHGEQQGLDSNERHHVTGVLATGGVPAGTAVVVTLAR